MRVRVEGLGFRVGVGLNEQGFPGMDSRDPTDMNLHGLMGNMWGLWSIMLQTHSQQYARLGSKGEDLIFGVEGLGGKG